jgi:hypothetical protein
MTEEEFLQTRKYIETKAIALMDHEKKASVIAGVPFANYKMFEISDRKFYVVQNNTFKVIVDEYLQKAQVFSPENFGTGNAYDVIKALYLIKPFGSFDWFLRFLSEEKFGYVFESADGQVIDRFLRLDLFRLIKDDASGNPEFVGGMLHALKHFSREKINYSTGNYKHELAHPYELITEIIQAFFSTDGSWESNNKYVVLQPYDENYNLKFVFYREENTGVFFLNTAYKKDK